MKNKYNADAVTIKTFPQFVSSSTYCRGHHHDGKQGQFTFVFFLLMCRDGCLLYIYVQFYLSRFRKLDYNLYQPSNIVYCVCKLNLFLHHLSLVCNTPEVRKKFVIVLFDIKIRA